MDEGTEMAGIRNNTIGIVFEHKDPGGYVPMEEQLQTPKPKARNSPKILSLGPKNLRI